MAALPSPSMTRPTIRGTRYMASTGHPLATAAAVRILEAGVWCLVSTRSLLGVPIIDTKRLTLLSDPIATMVEV